MRKLDIANIVKDRVGGMSKKESSLLIDELLKTIKNSIIQNESVKVSGFGSFVVREKKERTGRNPHTGTELAIPKRRVMTFKPSQLLRQAINQK